MGPVPCRPWSGSGSSVSPTQASRRCTTPLAGGGALAAPYAFATTDPNVGMARVPDPRLDALAEMSKSKNVVPATVQFVDIGGLVAGASKGEGLGNKFLSHIREVDAIVFVLRAFADDDVPGPSDPLEHLAVVELELTYADLETVETQIEKRRKAAKGDRSLLDEVAALDKAKAVLETGTPIYRSDLTAGERSLLKGLLPAHQPSGVGPGQRGRGPARRHRCRHRAGRRGAGGSRRGDRHVRPARGRGRPARRRRARRDARGPRAGRRGAPQVPARRLQAARAAHLPHHRREGVAGLDVPGRLPRPAVRRA